MKSTWSVSAQRLKVQELPDGDIHCAICTHTVKARVDSSRRRSFVVPGQKCPRCKGSLDAGYILKAA